jgi:hypothetical protein
MSYNYVPLTSDHPVLFTPPGMDEKKFQLKIAPPTPRHEDQLNSHIAVLGLTRVGEDELRAIMISELFNMFPEEEAEKKANFLDSCWIRMQVEGERWQAWARRDEEARIDEASGAPRQPREAAPEPLLSAREKADARLLLNDIRQFSVKLRMKVAEQSDYGNKSNALMVRMHVLPEAKGFTFEDGRDDMGVLTENDVARLKNAIGATAFDSIVAKIDSLYSFGEKTADAGNSDSPSGKDSDPTGSTEASTGSVSSTGNSTASSTEPAPATA